MSVSADPDIPPSRSRSELTIRLAVGLIGVGLIAVGLHKFWLLPDRVSMAKWAFGPVVLHDALVGPAVCLGGWAASRVLPRWTWSTLVTGVVVTAGLVLVSLSVVRGYGASPLNPSLDNRNYAVGLVVALCVVWSLVGVALLARSRQRR